MGTAASTRAPANTLPLWIIATILAFYVCRAAGQCSSRSANVETQTGLIFSHRPIVTRAYPESGRHYSDGLPGRSRGRDANRGGRVRARRHPANAAPHETHTVRPQGRLDADVLRERVRTGEGLVPLRKFRSVEETPGADCRTPLDPDNLRIAFDLSATTVRPAGRRFPPGVYRFHSITDAWERRQAWERSPCRAASARRAFLPAIRSLRRRPAVLRCRRANARKTRIGRSASCRVVR